MADEKFKALMKKLDVYLSTPNIFITDPKRMRDVTNALEIAGQLFPEANIHLAEDPLTMGALIIRIDDFDLTVQDTESFHDMVRKADNFQVYSPNDDEVRLSVLFNGALKRIKP